MGKKYVTQKMNASVVLWAGNFQVGDFNSVSSVHYCMVEDHNII